MTQVSVTSYGECGLDILHRSVVKEALHDSGERFPEPACHPGTRTSILEELRTWSLDTAPESTIFWLHGSAGVGKSAIAQAFASECQTRGRLGASFFFWRGHAKRGTWHGLLTTLAYQLATSISELLLPIQRAVELDKLIDGRSMAVQFQKLILEPFGTGIMSPFLPIITLDGLDECEGHKIQQQILRLFIGAIRSGRLAIRILIVSRPEPHIREVLDTQEASTICHHSMLSADTTEIRIYLHDEFQRMHAEYKRQGIELGTVWPPAGVLDHLVTKSSGIFIYATTVIRFVEDQYSHPADQLESVLSLDPRSTAPLDDLYTKILSALAKEPTQLRILHMIWRTSHPDGVEINPEEIDMLLALRPGTSRLILRGLHSLFSVPPVRHQLADLKSVKFLHASFADYLRDAHRSGQWCVSVPWLRSDYLHSMIRMLSMPPLTFNARILYSNTLRDLCRSLELETPSAGLITMMCNQNFQNSLFLAVYLDGRWPQEDSQYPRDLLQLWKDHSFIATFTRSLLDCMPNSEQPPTFQFDWIYQEIFTQNPDVLLLLRTLVHNPRYLHLSEILRLYGMTYRIFEPFARFQQFLQFPFHKGNSPLDFLTDPGRSGVLYRNPEDVAEDYMLLWIHQAKEVLEGRSDFPLWG
ncbi:hypothetical protein DFH07DRAFT_177458 [Mycena maculata]|uniref:Nephrocystin 3-like N-terminal domain-containing protein n=1 Tax=Mycena maculata TaxID=230809 RepID=A0AAD7MSE4_9AGAR|nr:hypothetical protein DFH07DRAFT_177458 [Mycena maculata]